MRQTKVYFTAKQYRWLERLARERAKTITAIVRGIVESSMIREASVPKGGQ